MGAKALPRPAGEVHHTGLEPDAEPPSCNPAALGYRMPAEWERHEATWIAWPHNAADWPGKSTAIPWVYAEIVRQLGRGENVRILVNSRRCREKAEFALQKTGVNPGRIEFYDIPTDRSWLRDSGPVFVVNRQADRAIVDWKFNAWAKYANWRRDNRITSRIAERLGLPWWQALARGQPIVLEGGSIDVNGAGLLLTTEECLLDQVQARNPDLSRSDLEQALAQ